mgnify:CR=1 FL=1
MWMDSYITEIGHQLRDLYKFKSVPDNINKCSILGIPDGEYPMVIRGKLDRVCIVNGKIDCFNFDQLA